MSDFDIELFKQRLAETIAYCFPQVDPENPKDSLRTIIPPHINLPSVSDLYDNREKLVEFAHLVFEQRFVLLQKEQKISALTNLKFEAGKLLVMLPGVSDYGGGEYGGSNGFFDGAAFPAWDTWVYLGEEQLNGDPERYIISWIPPQIIKDAQDGINDSAMECIWWATDQREYYYPFNFLKILKSAGLLF